MVAPFIAIAKKTTVEPAAERNVLLISSGPVKLIHEYKLFRGKELLAEAESTLACVNRDGEVCRIPANLEELTAEEGGVEE